jgi:tRNA-2-methylthio-N6-dimethylallyladenosine synthase
VAKKYLIETYGCQMNVHDSERMAGLLEQAGYEPTSDDAEADVVVINTCSVREHAEEKLYTRLGQLRGLEDARGDRPVVVVAGCVAQQEGPAIRQRAGGRLVDVVLGTQRVKLLPTLVAQAAETRQVTVDVSPWDDVTFPLGVTRRGDPVRAYVTIIEGCNDFCTFCVVPYTRGHERMRRKADILADVAEAAASGRKEIQLLGQIVNHYRDPDDGVGDFADLLAAVHDIPGVERIRFASPHPRHTGRRLLEAVRDLPKVCRHLHLPVQSGSTRVLERMRRRYTRESYLDLIAEARETIPDLALSTDMIVGFPGETAEDFDLSLSLTAAARYHSMFSFKYSPRPNTFAQKRLADDVSEAEKTARIVALQSLQRDIQTSLHEAMVGRTVDVLIDGVGRRDDGEISGRTHGNTVVSCARPAMATGPEGWLGRTVSVRVRRAGPFSVWGELDSPVPQGAPL